MAYNNVYIVEGAGERLMVDTGPDYRGARELLAGDLAGRLPGLVIATHGHLDHAGLGRWWESRGIGVALGAADAHFAAAPQLRSDAEFGMLESLVRASGAPADVQAEVLGGLHRRRHWAARAAASKEYPPAARDGRWPSGLRYESFSPSVSVDAERDLPAGGRAVLMPGHTPGNLIVLQAEEGWLFSGDQLLPEITPTPPIQRAAAAPGEALRFRSLPRFVDSLRRLQGFSFTRCWPGHGEPFDNVSETIAANLVQVDQRSERVLEAVRILGSARLFPIAEELYPKAVRRRFWQIASTIQGHLDLLEDAGRIRCVDACYEEI
jgi:glyoxylase-like metal-dependent hydrolase (beta-lactamase superfamily II)